MCVCVCVCVCTHDCVCMCDEIVLVSSRSQIVELAGYTARASEMFRVFREVKAGKCIMTSTVARDNEGNCIVPTIHTYYLRTYSNCVFLHKCIHTYVSIYVYFMCGSTYVYVLCILYV